MPEPRSLRYRRPPAPKRRFPVVPAAIAGVLLLAVVAVVVAAVSRGDEASDAPGVEQTRPVSVDGTALPPLGEGADGAVGQTAPTIEGQSFDGTDVSLGADGRPKVLVFLAHWCPHCQAEVPRLAEWLADNGAPADVDVYGVATATSPDRPNHPPSEWLAREGFDVPILADDEAGTAAAAYGLGSFPYFVALDGDNRVVARASGELTIEQWEDLLDAVRGPS